MIPKDGWKSMEDAPRDGTIIIVRFNGWNKPTEPEGVAPAQWLCDNKGSNWGWYHPWSMGRAQFANGWMTYAEFLAAQATPKTQEVEFDL